jgi:tripeptide aminopeptidase
MQDVTVFNEKTTLLERFLRYVAIDTQSDEQSATYPSTAKQLNLSCLLRDELAAIGLEQVNMRDFGYVTALLPGNLPPGHDVEVPAIAFIAHVDTSPAVSGKDVKAQIVENYQGGDIVLPGAAEQVIRFAENPSLADSIGHDLVTTDGTTLLGADNKAGVAEIMAAMEYLKGHPEIQHGDIWVLFTVDEEVGRGADKYDDNTFAARFAYTIDGETVGEIEDETFCADSAKITVRGVNIHPGYAYGRMVNALKIAAEIVAEFPSDRISPETTKERQGYIHPNRIEGMEEETVVDVIIRDFTEEGLKDLEDELAAICARIQEKYPKANIKVDFSESYRNMKYVINQYPFVTDYALIAAERAGLKPELGQIRGGTDGSRLSFMGLPCPNIFTGGHNFHSHLEFISIRDMEKTVETIVHLAQVWAEKGQPG